MEEAQRLEIAERIRELRERSPYTQPLVAEKLGIGLRAYQKMEAQGTTKWERCEELADIYDVDARWIWDGTESGETPDLLGALNDGAAAKLDRIEKKLDEVLRRLSPDPDEDLTYPSRSGLDGDDPSDQSEEAPPSTRRDRAEGDEGESEEEVA